ncbi:MAG: 3',5'-cyclic-nucleotide phosphodiesterase [Desulfuromonadales bacterium]
MRLQILGSAGAEFPDFHPPAFLIDGQLLLDAGTIGSVLSEEEQWKIRDIFITHSHLDHIRGIPVLADNIIMKNLKHNVTVHSTVAVISALKNHIFNGVIWPDFTVIPSAEDPIITYATIEPYKEYAFKGYTIQTIPVNHTVPAVGFRLESGGKILVYTGDTGPTEDIWKYCSGVDALIVEVSFPNNMEHLAQITKHLTSSMLIDELDKIAELPERILITHPKPQYYSIIRSEIECLGIKGIELLHDGTLYDI